MESCSPASHAARASSDVIMWFRLVGGVSSGIELNNVSITPIHSRSKRLGHLRGPSRPLLPPQLPRQARTSSPSPLSQGRRLLISRNHGFQVPRPRSTPTPPTLQLPVMLCASPSTGRLLRPYWTVNVLQRFERMQDSSAQTRIQTSCPKACAFWSPFLQTWMPPSVHSSKESTSVTRG